MFFHLRVRIENLQHISRQMLKLINFFKLIIGILISLLISIIKIFLMILIIINEINKVFSCTQLQLKTKRLYC